MRRLRFIEKRFLTFALCVVGASSPVGIGSQRDPRLLLTGSGAAFGLSSFQELKRGGAGRYGFSGVFTLNACTKMLTAATAPYLDGKGTYFLNYEQQVRSWRQETNLGPAKRAAE